MSEIKVRGPKGCGKTISHEGKVHEADPRGIFTVSHDFAEQLSRHGFQRVDEPPRQDKDAKP